ncbi:MAG: hypothetical protein QW409_03190 [Candidatus Aenigmatarchaeota archaeon]
MVNGNMQERKYKKILTTINLDLYEKIKNSGIKINFLIDRGYKCVMGECPSVAIYKKEIEECRKKLVESELKAKSENEGEIKKYVTEINELKTIKAYLTLILQHLLNKYIKTREQFLKELNEIFDEEKKEQFLNFVRERKIFLSFSF